MQSFSIIRYTYDVRLLLIAWFIHIGTFDANRACADDAIQSSGFRRSIATQPARDAMWGYQTTAPVQANSKMRYVVLPKPAPLLKHREDELTNRQNPPVLEARSTEQYAYGWFGAKTTQHWYRQFGHQKNYTQWTLR